MESHSDHRCAHSGHPLLGTPPLLEHYAQTRRPPVLAGGQLAIGVGGCPFSNWAGWPFSLSPTSAAFDSTARTIFHIVRYDEDMEVRSNNA
jgi:hypothetical protein